MSFGSKLSLADFLKHVAGAAKLTVRQLRPNLVAVPFDMGGGRSQSVYVEAAGEDAAGNLIVTFFSPALELPGGQRLGEKAANQLLEKNAKAAHGAWAIKEVDGTTYLGACDTQIAQTMDPPEFRASAMGLAAMADGFEKGLGKDVF